MASTLPKTYKAAFFREAGKPLSMEDVELKQPEMGQVLIKVLATGVCHSEAFVHSGLYPLPRIPGHETIGEVVALGPAEKNWNIGDRVGATWHGGHDGTCKACRRGLYQMCVHEEINGVTRDGGYAEYCLLRSEAVVRVPKDIDPAAYAPLLCAGVTVFNGIRQMEIPPGEIVAIQGLGGLGHLALQFASKMGYRVVALSSSGSKEKFARDLGADEYVDGSKEEHGEALQKLGGAALVVITAPNPDLMGPLINGLGIRGKLLVLSPCGDVPFNTFPMVKNGISVHGWPSGHMLDCEETIDFAKSKGVKSMIEKFPLAEANKAFEHMMSGDVRFRAVLTMT